MSPRCGLGDRPARNELERASRRFGRLRGDVQVALARVGRGRALWARLATLAAALVAARIALGTALETLAARRRDDPLHGVQRTADALDGPHELLLRKRS